MNTTATTYTGHVKFFNGHNGFIISEGMKDMFSTFPPSVALVCADLRQTTQCRSPSRPTRKAAGLVLKT
jgi:hypothetical protein